MTTNSPCNDDRLESLLQNSDQQPLDGAIAEHVESCPRCQSRLLKLATSDPWRWEIEETLRSSPEQPSRSCTISIVIATDDSLADDVAATCEPLSLDFLGAQSHPEMLGRLGRYEIERVIGAGGMGIVLKGFDTELHRPVAIKVLAPHLAHSGAARVRFAREARSIAAIAHEHVLPIHDVDSTAKLPYLVMPFVAGQSLQARLDAAGPMAVRDILRIAWQVAEGLAAAHAQGIVHRDVKPANILLDETVERAHIMDFGLARAADDASLTRSGIIAGTPFYMSPEQTRGEPIDERSDLFSLGSVIYAMCTGKPPFRAASTMGVLRKISDAEPRPLREENPDIPRWLDALVRRLMVKSPPDRLASASETADLLKQLLAHVNHPDLHAIPSGLRDFDTTNPPRRETPSKTLAAFGSVVLLAIAIAALALPRLPLWHSEAGGRRQEAGGGRPTSATSNAMEKELPGKLDWDDDAEAELRSLDRATRILEIESSPSRMQSPLTNPPPTLGSDSP